MLKKVLAVPKGILIILLWLIVSAQIFAVVASGPAWAMPVFIVWGIWRFSKRNQTAQQN